MDFGDWIGGVLIVGGLIFSAFSDKKKSKEKEAPSERDVRHNYEQTEEESSPFAYSNAFRSFFIEEDSDAHVKEDISRPKPEERPAIPPDIPSDLEEGQRITADISSLALDAEPKASSEKPFALHDKNVLRRAIILADILPPKF